MTEPNFADMPIDRLRWLAEHANPPGRNAARKALEARQQVAKADAASTYNVVVGASEFGTPRPEIRVRVPAARNHRELLGVLHDVAAGVERQLAPTREAWEVGIRRVDEREGAVYLDLMDGHRAEVDRALAVLNALVSPGAPVPARQRPRRERPATGHGAAAYAADAAASGAAPAPAPADAAPAKPWNEVDVPEIVAALAVAGPDLTSQAVHELAADIDAARTARRGYRRTAGKAADRFQERVLKRDRAELPACVTAVLDGGYRTGEYWTWLRGEYVATKGAK